MTKSKGVGRGNHNRYADKRSTETGRAPAYMSIPEPVATRPARKVPTGGNRGRVGYSESANRQHESYRLGPLPAELLQARALHDGMSALMDAADLRYRLALSRDPWTRAQAEYAARPAVETWEEADSSSPPPVNPYLDTENLPTFRTPMPPEGEQSAGIRRLVGQLADLALETDSRLIRAGYAALVVADRHAAARSAGAQELAQGQSPTDYAAADISSLLARHTRPDESADNADSSGGITWD